MLASSYSTMLVTLNLDTFKGNYTYLEL